MKYKTLVQAVFISLFCLCQAYAGSKTSLVLSNDSIISNLNSYLASTQVKSLFDDSLKEKDTIPPVLPACPNSSQVSRKAFHRDPGAMYGYARSFFEAYSLLEGDTSQESLRSNLKKAVLAIADANIASAINVSSSMWGWNGLSSSWDAYGNGTCTPATTPNLFDSAHALMSLEYAYEMSAADAILKKKYLDAFLKGANYWLDTTASTVFNSNYTVNANGTKTYAQIIDFQKTKPTSVIYKKMILGGQRTDSISNAIAGDSDALASGKMLPRPIRFFYTEDDPALVSLNCSALLGLAFLKMGLRLKAEGAVLPTYTLPLSSTSSTVKDLYYIGYWSVYPIFYNLKKMNGSYEDIDTIRYLNNSYESHLATVTLPAMMEASILLGSTEYKDSATNTLTTFSTEIKNDPRTLSSQAHSFCVMNKVSPVFLQSCKDVISPYTTINATWLQNILIGR